MTKKNRIFTIQRALLGLLFFWLPLVFSHMASLIGITAPGVGGYERYKVYFLVMTVFITSWLTFLSDTRNIGSNTKELIFSSGLVALLCFYWVLFRDQTFSGLIVGTPEKHHGIIFFLSLAWLIWVLKKLHSRDLWKQAVNGGICAGIIVSVYALIQYVWGDPITWYIHGGWDTGRVFSTLGNPSYLAGYLLLLLPLLGEWDRRKQVVLWMLFSLVIVATGSMTAIVLALGYAFWKALSGEAWGPLKQGSPHHGDWIRNNRFILTGISLIGTVGVIYLFSGEKILSLEARLSLWNTALQVFLQDPSILFLGNGPDSIPAYFTQNLIDLNPRYFAPGNIIDSFHNIFIDTLFFFGLPTVIGIVFLIRRWKYLPMRSQEWILLYFLFFSFHIAISVHYVLLLCYLLKQWWTGIQEDNVDPIKKSLP